MTALVYWLGRWAVIYVTGDVVTDSASDVHEYRACDYLCIGRGGCLGNLVFWYWTEYPGAVWLD